MGYYDPKQTQKKFLSREAVLARLLLCLLAKAFKAKGCSMSHKNILSLLLVIVACSANGKVTEDTNQTSNSNFPKPREVASQEETRTHVGILAGIATPEGSYDSRGEYGLDIGYQPYIPIGLGLIAAYHETEAGPGTNLRQTDLLAKVTYNLGGTIPVIKDSYFGLGLGAVFKQDATNIASAPLLGFDIPLKEEGHSYLSLGASAKYVIVSGNDPDTLSVNGVLKYWY